MSRDWDKLRRQDKAKKPDLHRSFRPKKFRRFHSLRKPFIPFKSALPKKIDLPDIIRVLVVDNTFYSTWRRKKGGWRCIDADDPIEWFKRIRHPEVLEEWLRKNHFSHYWSKTIYKPADSVQSSGEKQFLACAETGHAVASLNIKTPDDLRGPTPQSTSGLEQNGLPNPHCLIATERTVEPESRSYRC